MYPSISIVTTALFSLRFNNKSNFFFCLSLHFIVIFSVLSVSVLVQLTCVMVLIRILVGDVGNINPVQCSYLIFLKFSDIRANKKNFTCSSSNISAFLCMYQ